MEDAVSHSSIDSSVVDEFVLVNAEPSLRIVGNGGSRELERRLSEVLTDETQDRTGDTPGGVNKMEPVATETPPCHHPLENVESTKNVETTKKSDEQGVEAGVRSRGNGISSKNSFNNINNSLLSTERDSSNCSFITCSIFNWLHY